MSVLLKNVSTFSKLMKLALSVWLCLPLLSARTSTAATRPAPLPINMSAKAIAHPVAQAVEAFCVPLPGFVPGFSGPPKWWTETEPPGNQTDDPRWGGAAQQSWGDGTSPAARMRALYFDENNIRYLYLGFDTLVDIFPNVTGDALVMGLSNSTTDLLAIVKPISSVSPTTNANPATVEYYTRPTGTSNWTSAAIPAWLPGGSGQTRIWLTRLSATAYTWSVNLRIPLNDASGVGLPNPTSVFSMYTNLVVQMGDAAGAPRMQHHFPLAAPNLGNIGTTNIPNLLSLPAVTTWGRVQTESRTCAGVNLSKSDQIGTIDSRSGTPVSSNRIFTNAVNTFYAWPANTTTSVVPAGAITARFRLANWGITLPGGDWKDIPGGNAVVSTGGLVAGASAPGSPITGAPIRFNWTLSPSEVAAYNAHPHQCMLVELTGNAGVSFTRASVTRNMDFAKASTFERSAEINITGLGNPPAGLAGHRLWIYVQHSDMAEPNFGTRLAAALEALFGAPSTTQPQPDPTPATPLPPLTLTPPINLTLTPGGPDIGVGVREAQGGDVRVQAPAKTVGWYAGWESKGLPAEVIARAEKWPTYRIYVFAETGESLEVDGQSGPVISLLGSYGFYFQHEGGLAGWTTSLNGLEQRGPNLYTVVVPKDGMVTVVDKIEAEEPNTTLGIAFLLGLLVFLILLYVLFRLLYKSLIP